MATSLIPIILLLSGLAGFALSVLALFRLHSIQLSGTAVALWVILIIVLPGFGGLAFFIVRPGRSESPAA